MLGLKIRSLQDVGVGNFKSLTEVSHVLYL